MPKFAENQPMFRYLDDFATKHIEVLRRLSIYRERKYRLNRSTPPFNRDTQTALRADDLNARITFAEIVVRNAVSWMEELDSRAGHRFVTVALGKHAVDPALCDVFDPRHLQLFIQKALKGFDFIGYVEFAYYPRWLQGKPAIHPHAHLLVRNASEKKLRAALSAITVRHASLIPGWKSASSIALSSGDVVNQLLYVLKFPLKSYAPYPIIKVTFHPETGEELRQPTGEFGQHKNDLRTGELDLMSKVLSTQFLDRLLFAGGGGIAVKDAIIGEALRPFRVREAAREARAALTAAKGPYQAAL